MSPWKCLRVFKAAKPREGIDRPTPVGRWMIGTIFTHPLSESVRDWMILVSLPSDHRYAMFRGTYSGSPC